jgi:hemerythrin superfamily protein
MVIYDAILEDHAKTRRMLRELSEVAPAECERRIALFADLKSALTIHQHVEEAVLYDRLQAIAEARPDTIEAMNEHQVIDTLLAELDGMAKDNDRWTAKLGALRELVEHHLEEEEGAFFSQAKEVLDPAQADRLGEEFQRQRRAGIQAMTPLELD